MLRQFPHERAGWMKAVVRGPAAAREIIAGKTLLVERI
jgi:hypothetical protein